MSIDKGVDSTVLDGYFSDIADAIRGKNGSQSTYTPAQMPSAITNIPTGGDGDNMSFGVEPLVGVAKVGQSALCEEE